MASGLHLLSANPFNISTANYAKIPSWVSLKPTTVAPQTTQPAGNKLENVHLLSLSKQGKLNESLQFLQELDSSSAVSVSITPKTYENLLQTCARLKSLRDGRSVYQRVLRDFQNSPPGFLLNCAIRMCLECGSIADAERVFDETRERNSGSWGIMISAYCDQGWIGEAVELFSRMRVAGVTAGISTYVNLLRGLCDLEVGKQLHCLAVKSGFVTDVSLGTCLCNMYVKCGCLDSAERVFNKMNEKNVVTWTGMIVGLTHCGKQDDARRLFVRMVSEGVEMDEFVFSIALKVCAGLRDVKMGHQVHGQIIKLGLENEVSVGTPLVDFYVKCSEVDQAILAFQDISEPNDVTWSAIISGYIQIGESEKCFKAFRSLRKEDLGSNLNEFVYTSIFQACAAIADLNMGTQAHGDAIKRGLISYLHGESAMITMYAKCGRLDCAFKVFESVNKPDTVVWTSVIAACAYHGNASEALNLFRKMQASGVRPNGITFIAILTACSHCGLVEDGKRYLESMSSEYGVEPTIDHYDCMIDIYSRAGLLTDALNLIQTMPFEPDAMSWKSLLGGCSIHQNFKLGKMAAEKLLELDPNDTAAYVLMFNLHASGENWDEAAYFRRMMAERDLKKEVGCSWITVKGKLHRFIVGDRHHPQTEEIYRKLDELRFSRDNSQFSSLPGRKEQLLDHSERLAIAFGLISTPDNAPVLVFKNLRACRDCHDFAKHVSLITRREIVVRDASRFHHFKFGHCSCNDYW